MNHPNTSISSLDQIIEEAICHIESRSSEITAELRQQMPANDIELLERLLSFHMARLQESSVVLAKLFDMHAAGKLDADALVALAQWT